METDVVDFIEDAVTSIEGVKQITSTSRQGSANVTVEFDLARNIDVALQDVQTRVAQAARRLPREIDPPIITKPNPEDQPILWISLSRATAPPTFMADYVAQRPQAAVPDHRGRGRDHARRLPRARTSASGSTPRAWRRRASPCSDVDRRHPARAHRGAGRPHRDRPSAR